MRAGSPTGSGVRPLDIQVNGYAGADFSAPSLTVDDCRRACAALAADGVDGILATVITDTVEGMCGKLARLAAFRAADPEIARMIVGVHAEGPFLSPAPGYRGAHDASRMRPADVESARRLMDAADGLLRLVTLAPEHDPGFATTAFLAARGIVVSAGHGDPSLDELRGAVDAGLTMVTHLGNGCPTTLPRHDNVIQRALHLRDRLWLCFIPDGVHVPFFALANYLALAGIDRSIMVTDAISAATLGPGVHELAGVPVEIDVAGVARRPGSENLAGSTVRMPRVLEHLAGPLGLPPEAIALVVDRNPRRALGLPAAGP